MKKWYCDVCGAEVISSGTKTTTVEVEQLLLAGDINDICDTCLNAIEHANLTKLVREAVARISPNVPQEATP